MVIDQQLVQTQLAEARAAFHALNTGRMARVVVDQNGERVEFTATNRNALYGYIQQLERLLAPGSTPPKNGPAGFVF